MPHFLRSYYVVFAALSLPACGENGTDPDDPPPAIIAVDVGNDFFRSGRNTSTNPAVDTVSVNGTATWTWTDAGEHSVMFEDPDLPAGDVMTTAGSQYSVSFPNTGAFAYFCSVHGLQMTGSVIVR